jgi:hypothetical protein
MDTFATRRRAFLLGLVLLLCVLGPACRKSKVTPENFDKVQTGMTLQEVQGLLGPGQKEEGGDGAGVAAQFGVDAGVAGAERGGKNVDTYVWESGARKITVYFVNGKVTNKQKAGF